MQKTMTINLVHPTDNIRIDKFPDGQQNVTITKPNYRANAIDIQCSLRNFKDVELLLATIASLKRLNFNAGFRVFIAYMTGARSDRQFEIGGNNYLLDVIDPILSIVKTLGNHCGIYILDCHNERVLKNATSETQIYDQFKNWVDEQINKKYIVVFPDEGAAVRYGHKYKNITHATKKRENDTVKVTCDNITLTPDVGAILVVDDLCDGGATFISVAEAIKQQMSRPIPIYLQVTHGVFSKGFEIFKPHYEKIFTTNSYQDIADFYTDSYGNIRETNVCQFRVI